MIHNTDASAIEEREVEESFVRAGGPGGQNVNKVATAGQLRFDLRRSPSLPNDVRTRPEQPAGRRLAQDAVLIVTARRYRTRSATDGGDGFVDAISLEDLGDRNDSSLFALFLSINRQSQVDRGCAASLQLRGD